jgi:CHASE3 domain sensor protein
VNDTLIRRLLALFLIIAVVLVAVAIVAVRNINRAIAGSDWVNHTHAALIELGGLRGGFHASDAALRALAMSGTEQDEAACREALSALADHLEVVKALTRSDARQTEQVARLEALTQARAALTREILAARRAGQGEKVRSLLAADAAAGAAAEVRRLTDKLRQEQMALLAARDSEAYLQAQTTRWTVGLGVALNFILLGVTAWLVRDDLAARRRAATILEEANRELDAKVQVRTAELATTNERLSTENLERRWSVQALEHQLRYNELIVNSISDLVLVLTKAQNISRINPAVTHLTGYDSTQLINHHLLGLVRFKETTPALAPSASDPLTQALKEGRDLRDVAALVVDRHSRLIPVRLTLFPLRDRDKVVGGVVVLRVETESA